jgi:autotransporter-associated beta strand protein
MESGLRARVTGGLVLALFLASSSAKAQWIETGPYTSTNTYSSSSGSLNSSTTVLGIPAQGDPVYGAINAVAQSPVDPNTYWVATVSGGIWKTSDGGKTWKATTDGQASLAIGAITVDTADPTGKTLYAATGDYSAGFYHFSPQTALLKSTDGGNSWTSMALTGLPNRYLAGGAQLDPSAPYDPSIKTIIAMGNVILLAAGGSTATYFNSGGLYRSTDGGATFTPVSDFKTEVSSLISTTINNQTVLLAARNGFGDHNATAVLYSTDSGASWTPLLGPNTTVHSTHTVNPDSVAFNGGDDVINMKVASGVGGSLFVAVAKQNTAGTYDPIGLFYTPQFTPGTAPTWYNISEPQYFASGASCSSGCTLEGNPQAATHFALIADPNQKGVAYIAGSGLFNQSITGLASLNEVSTIVRVNYDPNTQVATYTPIVFPTVGSAPHPDTRQLVFNSQGNLLTTDDGGIYSLTNPATSTGTWSALGGVAADGSPIRAIESYSAVMDPKTGRLGFAAQDNGTGFSPVASLSQFAQKGAWQGVISGDGFSVAVNSKTSGPSILYATADDSRLARVFSNQNLSASSPPTLLDIQVNNTGNNYYSYETSGPVGIVVAVNAVDPTKLLFRAGNLYTWTDPGTALSDHIDVTNISNGTIFGSGAWAEKIAYGTQDAPDAILAGGPLAGGGYGVFLRTQEQVNLGQTTVGSTNLLSSFNSTNDPMGVLFDPSTEHKFFIVDTVNAYRTSDTGQTLSTLTLPTHFQHPTSLGYIADGSGNAVNGVRALLVGGITDGTSSQSTIISTLDPFATNVQWMNVATGLPNVAVMGLNYYPDIDTLVAATYGRGVYTLYDVTSYFPTATALWFGKANNDSAPDPSLLTGNRPLEKFGTGTLTLTGPATYTGGTFILGGTLATGSDAAMGDPSGQIGIDTGTLRALASFSTARTVTFGADGGTIDVGTFNLTASGLWLAQGPVTKTGSGMLALEGLGSFQTVNVAAGTLQVDGTITGTSLQVASGATLSGTGQIGAPTTIAGTLAPGDAPGVLTFTAPLVLASGSTLAVSIDGTATGGGAGTYSQVVVNGASLTLGGTLSPIFRGINGGNNNFTPSLGQQFMIASATGGITGQFSGVNLAGSGLPSWLRMDTIYQPTAVDLVTTPASYAAAPPGLSWSANQQSVGAALDSLRPAAGSVSSNAALQNAFNALYLLSPTQLASTLTGLSGESEARGVANTLDAVDAIHTALQDHLLGGPLAAGFNNLSFAFDGGGGRNLYSSFNSINKAPASTASSAAGMPPYDPNHWWGSAFYRATATGTSGGIAGNATSTSGLIAGVEGEIRPGWLLGAAAAVAHTDASGLGSGSGDDYALVVYGRRTAGALQAAAYVGGVHDNIGLRHDFGSGAPSGQSSGANSLIAGGSIAYTIKLGNVQVVPTATLAFTHMLFDGANWTSPQGFTLNIPRQWADRLRFTLGPTVSRDLTTQNGVMLYAMASGGFLYETGATALDAGLFSVPTVAQSAHTGNAGAYAALGLNASFTKSLTAFVRWQGEARAHSYSNQISGGLSATF